MFITREEKKNIDQVSMIWIEHMWQIAFDPKQKPDRTLQL